MVLAAFGQQATPKSRETRVLVSTEVARQVLPILDLRMASVKECGIPGEISKCINGQAYDRQMERQKRFNELLSALIFKKGRASDEALVVLMCFYVGESGEEVDEVMDRGSRMLRYLDKYKSAVPHFPERDYPSSMLQAVRIKTEHFNAAIASCSQHKGKEHRTAPMSSN